MALAPTFDAARPPILGLGLLLLSPAVTAQIEYGGAPPSARVTLPEAATVRMAKVDMLALGARVAQEAPDGAFRFGEVLQTELSIDTHGEWETLPGGDRVWRLRVASEGAFSLMLVFSSFRLPEGGELFAYDETREFVHGAYTHLSNKLSGKFAIQPIPGDAVTLEYYHPRGAEEPLLTLSGVVHDYRDAFGYTQLRNGGLGASQACEVDLACPQGTGWQDQGKSVVKIVNSVGLCCSGTLVNNTAGDGAALVLTAAHCLNLDDAVFTFNFDRPLCGSGAPPTTDTIACSTSLVMDTDLDFNLVRLDQAPPPSYDVRLAGWDRTDVVPLNTTCIHHPRGDAKKISLDVDPPTKSTTFWNLATWEVGVTEGGSSGSPLFDPSGRLIGHLIMGASQCATPVNDFFGRIAERWELLAPYLDPLNTGQLTTDLLDPSTIPTPTFAVTGFHREVLPVSPGSRADQTLSGSGFTQATTVSVDGAPLSAPDLVFQGPSTLQLNLPVLDVGTANHTVVVSDGASTRTLAFDVAAPTGPIFQVGTGDPAQAIFSFVPTTFTHVGPPGDVQLCLVSDMLVPSVLPGLVALEIGANFTDLHTCMMMTIPPTGHASRTEFLNLQLGVTYYGQTISVNSGFPVPVSNLQSGTFNF